MRILEVEDEPELAGLVVEAFRKAGTAIDGVGTLGDARAAMRAVHYGCIILDLGMPDGNGIDFLRDLRARDIKTPIIILTARDAIEDRVAGLNAGADDYLLKPFHMSELIARVNALLRRPGDMLGPALACGNVRIELASREVRVAGASVAVPRRELAMLEMLMRRAGKVVLKDAMESDLYGFGEEVESNAVEVNMHRLRKRLARAGADIEIHTVRGVGYILMDAGR